MNRGSAPNAVTSLECSPGFNEAPIHESGKCRFCETPAQLDVSLQ